MDFSLSDDQQALRDGVRSFCEGRIGIETLRRLEGTGFDRALWSELAALGLFALRAGDGRDEEAAGRAGLAEAVLVFEALGRAAAPGPILWSHLAAGIVPGAASGEVVVTGVEAMRDDADPWLIEHLDAADAVLVLRDDGLERITASSIASEPVERPLDPLTPIRRAAALPRGERIGDATAADRLRLEGTTLAAAQLLGIAEEAVALATRHATERQQFDRPIGSFQAIKHILADCFVRQELARATVYAAGVLLDEGDDGGASDDARRAVAAAKLIAGDAAMKNVRACIQVQGGMGFTWESPVHYYLKRTWVLENGFGTTRRHADALAAGIAATA